MVLTYIIMLEPKWRMYRSAESRMVVPFCRMVDVGGILQNGTGGGCMLLRSGHQH